MGGHLFIQDGWKIFLRFVCPAERMRDGSAVPCIVKRGEPAGPLFSLQLTMYKILCRVNIFKSLRLYFFYCT